MAERKVEEDPLLVSTFAEQNARFKRNSVAEEQRVTLEEFALLNSSLDKLGANEPDACPEAANKGSASVKRKGKLRRMRTPTQHTNGLVRRSADAPDREVQADSDGSPAQSKNTRAGKAVPRKKEHWTIAKINDLNLGVDNSASCK